VSVVACLTFLFCRKRHHLERQIQHGGFELLVAKMVLVERVNHVVDVVHNAIIDLVLLGLLQKLLQPSVQHH